MRLAEVAGHAGLLDDANATLDTVRFMLGRGPPADLRERAAAPLEGDETGQERLPTLLQRSLTWAAMLKWTDDFDAAREALERLRTHLSSRQEEALLFPVLFHLGELECWAGNFGAARRWAMEMKNVSVRAGQPGLRAQSLYLEALVESLVGQVAEARVHGMEGLRLAEEAGDVRVAIRQLKVLGPSTSRSGSRLTQRVASPRRSSAAWPQATATPAFPGRGRHDRSSDSDRAARPGRATPGAARTARGDARPRLGARDRGTLPAVLASARGDPTAALVALEGSLQEHTRLAEPLELGRTLLVDGALRRRTKQRRLARASLEDAHDLPAARCAALGGPARAKLARISGRTPAPGALTQTERRVAELVTAGR